MEIMGKNKLIYYLPADGQEYLNAIGTSTIYVSKEYLCKMTDVAYEANINPQATLGIRGLLKWAACAVFNRLTESGIGIRNVNLGKLYDQRDFIKDPNIQYAERFLLPKPFDLRSPLGVSMQLLTYVQIILLLLFICHLFYICDYI